MIKSFSRSSGDKKKLTGKRAPKAAKAPLKPVEPPAAQPGWFAWALSEPVDQSIMVEHEGRNIHVLRWGGSQGVKALKRALLFVHGGGASNSWYKFIAPFFAAEFDCLALSLSGNGESDWATQYSSREWGREILTICKALDVFSPQRQGKPLVVAHSMGTYITMHALSMLTTDHFEGVVLVDAAIRNEEDAVRINHRIVEMRKTDPTAQMREGWNVNPPSVTPLQRFKLRPFQECANMYIMQFIATQGARELGGEEGWTWKGDPNREAKFDWPGMFLLTDVNIKAVAKRSKSKFCFMYGEESVLCDANVIDFTKTSLSDVMPVVGIPAAGHHVWLDQPIGFVTALRSTFSAWGVTGKASHLHEEDEFIRREAALEAKL